MKKLDLYIIRKYLTTFLFAIIMITAIAVVMDLSENIDKFIRHKLSASTVFFDYYVHFVPWINGELWPLFAFLAVIFFTSRLARDSEIIAMLSTGMNYSRILRPMLIAGSLIAVLHWVGENYVIPHSTFHKTEFENEYKRKVKIALSNDAQFFISPNQKIYCNFYRKRDSTLSTFRLESFDDEGNLISMLKAKKLKYNKATNNWTANDYEIRSFNGKDEHLIIGKGEQLDTAIAITPADFIRHSKQMEIMTTPDLKEFVIAEKAKGLDSTNRYQVEAYKRTAAPFTIIILTLIGASIGTRKIRGGLGIHLAMGVSIGALFTLISKFAESFANTMFFAPLIGVWTPNIIFGLFSLYLLRVAQK